MKKNFFFTLQTNFLLLVTPLFALLGVMNVNAQIPGCVTPASIMENYLYTGADPSTALIDYSPNCNTCGIAQLKVVSWWDVYPNAGIIVSDGINPNIVISQNTGIITGVALGNNTTASTDYRIATVQVVWNTLQIQLDIYNVTKPGTPLFAVTHLGSWFLATPTLTTEYGPHINIIAQYANLFPSGASHKLPLCDKFVVTWDDNQNIWAYYGSINNLSHPSSGIKQQITSTSSTMAVYPDIAGVDRLVSGTHRDMGLITYLEGVDPLGRLGPPTPANLYYREWNPVTGVIGAPLLLDSIQYPFETAPRIDAIDDYTINSPSGPLAFMCIVHDSVSGSPTPPAFSKVKVYNNLLPIPGGVDITSSCLSSADMEIPHITQGPDTEYTVDYVSYYPILGYGDLIAQNIGYGTGAPSSSFYQVNKTTILTPANRNSYVASTCNQHSSQSTVLEWYANDGMYEKFTNVNMLFKQTGVANINTNLNWEMSPNPAENYFTITSDSDPDGETYAILDLAGHMLQQDRLIKKSTTIDITLLSSGMYFVNIYANGSILKTGKLIKR